MGVSERKRNTRITAWPSSCREKEFFIDNLLVRIHFIIVMIRWTGLAPWEFEFPFPAHSAPAAVTRRALTPNTVELIPTIGALFPRCGPVQDPVLTLLRAQAASLRAPTTATLQGYLAHKKLLPPRTLQKAYA